MKSILYSIGQGFNQVTYMSFASAPMKFLFLSLFRVKGHSNNLPQDALKKDTKSAGHILFFLKLFSRITIEGQHKVGKFFEKKKTKHYFPAIFGSDSSGGMKAIFTCGHNLLAIYSLKVKKDHRSKFSNLSNWKEDA